MKPKAHAYYSYIGGGLLAAAILAIAGWGPLAIADKSQNPVFAVDPFWPKPLPAPVGTDGFAHPWIQGEVAGNCIDKNDNVYTFNRGWEVGVTVNGILQGNESGAIDSQDATDSAVPSPPVVAFDSDGNVIAGWGNPSLIQTGADYGYAAYMAHGAHGCFVDYQGYVWVAGNGDGIVQKYNPMAANAEGASATYVAQIGTKGTCDTLTPPAPGANRFTSCGTNGTSAANTSHTLLNEPADIAVARISLSRETEGSKTVSSSGPASAAVFGGPRLCRELKVNFAFRAPSRRVFTIEADAIDPTRSA
jgi:hypothetical protein